MKSFNIQISCNWMSPKDISHAWNNMTTDRTFTYEYNNVRVFLVWDNNPDIWIIINKPWDDSYIPSKSIGFCMEPFLEKKMVGIRDTLLKCCFHDTHLNILEWHLGKTYSNLLSHPVKTEENRISAIVSSKYWDVGHIKRINFIKYAEHFIHFDVFGANRDYIHYKGSLPVFNKQDGLFPYKYTFAAENNSIPNYITEKFVDAILSECFVFYWGSPNIGLHFDPRVSIQLDLDDFENDLAIIQNAISEKVWEQNIEYIRTEKSRILNDLNFFPFICKVLAELD